MGNDVKTGQHGIPGSSTSYWLEGQDMPAFPDLEGEITVDVAIVGGGAAGITCAWYLKKAGLTVAVIDASRVLHGVTGHTTAKITSLHRLVYANLISLYGTEKARMYADSNQSVIDKIANIAGENRIECDFARKPFFTFALDDENLKLVEKEVEAAGSLGLPVTFAPETGLPFNVRGAVRFSNQAQFHPYKFFYGLAREIPGGGSHVFEASRALHLDHGHICTVKTLEGRVKAEHVIIATNSPVFDREGFYFARLHPQRSYALSARVNAMFPEGMFIDADYEGFAWRTQPDGRGGQLVIISGGNHTPGHHDDTKKYYRRLEERLKEAYGDIEITNSWSTQDCVPYDGAPYIGRLDVFHSNVYVATGFAKWGMTTAFAAGEILTDLIQGRENPWAEVYNPLRFKADASTGKKLISENTHVVEMFIRERLKGMPHITALDIGEGAVGELDGKKVAASRDENGKLVKLNPNCTHMGCVLHWNNAERSWDCPCHGSRFDNHGRVIQSPAVKDLKLPDE